MTMIKGVLIPFDDDQPVKEVEFDNDDYMNITRLVAPDSGVFDRVACPEFDLWVDEEGLLHGEAGKRINARAMQLFAAAQNITIDQFASPLVGDALVLSADHNTGESTSAPANVIDFPFSWRTTPLPEQREPKASND